MSVPADRRYTPEHEWLAIDGEAALVGITEYAADALGDVVFVDLPAVGTTLAAGQACGEIESTKSVSEIYAPADGVVLETNADVETSPELVNADPFGAGWLFRISVDQVPQLLDAEAYESLTGSSDVP